MLKIFKRVVSSGVVFIIVAVLFYNGRLWYTYHYVQMLKKNSPESIKVNPDSGIVQLAEKLNRRGLWRYPRFLISITRSNGTARRLRYGEYWIKPSMSVADLITNIVDGKGMVRHHITFIEGWTFQQIKDALEKNRNITHRFKEKTDQQIMTMLGHPQQKPEGLFFPSTYYFLWEDSDLTILQMAYQKMDEFLTQEWSKRIEGLPYQNAYQVLIVASMVEKETALEKERPLIAGVILRRWKKKMRLQVDPTVLYGLKKPYGTLITEQDLRSKTPYNTYRIRGLPPTPIAMPGAASIVAALQPARKGYLYFVARGDGSHQFSTTYKEHLAAIKKYRPEERNIFESENEAVMQFKSKFFNFRKELNIAVWLVYWLVV